RYKIVDLEAQSKAVVSAMASLRSQEISKDLQLSYLNTFSSRDESTAAQLRQQLTVMNNKFKKLELAPEDDQLATLNPGLVGKVVASRTADMFPAAMSVPKLRFE